MQAGPYARTDRVQMHAPIAGLSAPRDKMNKGAWARIPVA
jgi:hypothetical protein